MDPEIKFLEQEKNRYEKKFEKILLEHARVACLKTIPGTGTIGAIKIAARVVDGKRFKRRNDFLSYCGLVKHEKMSGGRSYGRANTRYSRTLKVVFKTAVMAVLHERTYDNIFRDFYNQLIKEKNYPEFQARHAVARRIATIAYGIIKTTESFDASRLAKKIT